MVLVFSCCPSFSTSASLFWWTCLGTGVYSSSDPPLCFSVRMPDVFLKFPMNPGRYVLPRGRRAVCLSELKALRTVRGRPLMSECDCDRCVCVCVCVIGVCVCVYVIGVCA